MPIYKIYGKRSADRRDRRILARRRWMAIAVSAVLLGLAAVMFMHAH